jgi:hypothetical protein
MSNDTFNRPTTNGNHGNLVTTPHAASMIRLLGGQRHAGFVMTKDEKHAVDRLYGYKPELANAKPPPPSPPKREDYANAWEYNDALRKHEAALTAHAQWEDPRSLMQSGADINAMRHAEADGLRLLTWLARHLQPGEDPLRAVVQLAVDAGWDVDHEDVAWAGQEDDEESDDETAEVA